VQHLVHGYSEKRHDVPRLQDRHDLATVALSNMEALIRSHPEWSPATVNAAIGSWSVFFKWALRNGHVTADPTIDLDRVYVGREVKVLADDGKIRDALTDADAIETAVLLLGREAGLRRNEIATLRLENRKGDWLTVLGKGGRTRRINLPPRLKEALIALEHTSTTGFYFPGARDGHLAPEIVARKVIGLIGTSTHSLRRSAVTAVYKGSGGDIRVAQEFAGHASPNTTAIYIQVNEEDLIRAGGYAALAA
jgi:integrase